MSSDGNPESVGHLIAEAVLGADFRRATFTGPSRTKGPFPWNRVGIRPVELQGERQLQFSYFDATRSVTRNYRPSESSGPLEEILAARLAAIHLTLTSEEIDIRTTKKGKVFVGRRKVDHQPEALSLSHNRIKELPLPEGRADHLLEVLGILTQGGQVRPTMRAKFTQINEFLKQLNHVLDADDWLASLDREVLLLDCGCGASYLTLAAHHYLNNILRRPARILGVDVNDDLIRKSIERSERLGAVNVEFTTGRIGKLEASPDIVVALHACDTATDDAIAQAINSQAHVLLSVPCCHHDLNAQVRAEGPAEVLRPILRHGILQQRMADLVTDAFRALILRIMGYRTDVIEFISHEHTARNLMIRAVRGAPVGEVEFIREYRDLCQFWRVTPHLAKVLGESFQRRVEG